MHQSSFIEHLLTGANMARINEGSQPTKSFQTLCETLYENIFRHCGPCQLKVQITLIRLITTSEAF